MEIAVLGGGHGCYAAAADMAEDGHAVRFWRRDAEAFAPVLENGVISIIDGKGGREARVALATTDAGEAIRGADLILAPLPATAQAGLADTIAPHLADGQVVYLSPGTFGGYLAAKLVHETGNTADIAWGDAGTLPWLVRKQPDGTVRITTRAVRLPTGIFPARLSDHAFSVIEQAFPAIERRRDAMDAALLNYGPIIHPPLILMNAGPLQHFDAWDIHDEGTQPFIRAVATALDGERMALREALGYGPPHFPLADHYARDSVGDTMYGAASHDDLIGSGDWREDIDLYEHRYLREDVALGVAFLVSVGEWAGIPCPVARGLLTIAGAGVGEDFLETGRTLAALGLAGLSRDEMRALLDEGLAA